MSRMLQALRQLEATERLVTPAPPAADIADVDGAVSESASVAPSFEQAHSVRPLATSSTSDDHDEAFSPAYSNWNEFAELHDSIDGLTFTGFLAEADAKRSGEADLENGVEDSAVEAAPPEATVRPTSLAEQMVASIEAAERLAFEAAAEQSQQLEDAAESVADAAFDAAETVEDSSLPTSETVAEEATFADPMPHDDVHTTGELQSASVAEELAPLSESQPDSEASIDNASDELQWEDLFPAAGGNGFDEETFDDASPLMFEDALGELEIEQLADEATAETSPSEVTQQLFPVDAVGESTDEGESAPPSDEFQSSTDAELATSLSVEESRQNVVATEKPDDTASTTPDVRSETDETAASTEPEPAAEPSIVDVSELSPAEIAALADLKCEDLLQQYRGLAERVCGDLSVGEHRSAAFVGVEHQPHVTDAVLRVAMAACLEEQRHVLLVDASLSDKHLTAGLNVAAEFGLSEVLKGRVPWQQAVRATGTPGLCVLPAGRITPPEMAADDACVTNLLKELTCQWDLVLVDSGCCEEPAAKFVLSAARNVYLLVRLGETEAEAAEAAVATIQQTGATLRGCVATNVV